MATTPSPSDPQAGPRRSRYSHLSVALRYRDFRVLWAATASSQIGQGMQQVVLGWLVFNLTGSAAMVGVIFAVRTVPFLVVGFAAGSITDRVDRRTVLRWASVGMIIASSVMALLLYTDRLAVWHLMLGSLALGSMHAFILTSRHTYVYDTVGGAGVSNGIAMISIAQRLGGIVGALLAGVVLKWWGPGTAFLVMSVSYVIAFLVLFGLRHRGQAAPQTREPMWENLVNYFRALKTNRTLLSLMLSVTATETLGFSHLVMMPILAEEVLHVGPAGLGVLTALRFLGGTLGVSALAVIGEVRRPGVMLLSTIALFGVGLALLSQSPNFGLALLFIVFANMMGAAAEVQQSVLLQVSVSNELRGRAVGSWLVGIGTAPVGHLEVGYLATVVSARLTLLTNGVALAVVALLLAAALPRLRRL